MFTDCSFLITDFTDFTDGLAPYKFRLSSADEKYPWKSLQILGNPYKSMKSVNKSVKQIREISEIRVGLYTPDDSPSSPELESPPEAEPEPEEPEPPPEVPPPEVPEEPEEPPLGVPPELSSDAVPLS